MSQNQLVAAVAATLSALNGTDGAPESTLYLAACGGDIDQWGAVRRVLVGAALVEIKGSWVRLTDKGTRAAVAVDEVLAGK